MEETPTGRFSEGTRFLRGHNLILLTGLKQTLKAKSERILEIFKEMEK